MLEENEPEVDVTPETPDAPAADAAPAEPAPEWDGSLDTLEAQPWAKSIPDAAREHIRGQYERHTFYRGLVDAEDQVGKLTKELDGLRGSLGAEVKKYQGEATSWQERHDKLDTEYRGFRSEVEQARIEEKDTHVRETYPDIYATYAAAPEDAKHDSALAMFVKLHEQQGIPMDKAARMTRAAFDMPPPGAAPAAPAAPERPKERDVAPPPSVTMQAKNGLNPAEAIQRPPLESEGEARRRVMKQIEEEEARANGG